MKTQENNFEFDFSKVVTEPLKKFEKQSYKKVLFLAIGLSVFTTLGFSIKDSIGHHYELSNAVEAKKIALSLQEIKNMSNDDFDSMVQHVMKNSNIYDEKVHYIQSIIAKSEIENYQESMSTANASTLGTALDDYKQTLLNDSSKLSLIRKNVINDLPISTEDSELFFKYQTAYKTKALIRSKDLEDKMQDFLYSKNTGNNKYNNKYNVYDNIKVLDQKINNTFNVIETPKPKM